MSAHGPVFEQEAMPQAEADLVQRALDGDVEAFEALLGLHDQATRLLVWAMVDDRRLMDDVLRAAYEQAFRAIASSRGDSARTWLHRICWTAAVDALRHERHRRHDDIGDIGDIGDHRAQAVAAPAQSLIGRDLAVAWARLPADQRAALALVDIEGLDNAEAAAVCDTSPGTIASRVSWARERLRVLPDTSRPPGDLPGPGDGTFVTVLDDDVLDAELRVLGGRVPQHLDGFWDGLHARLVGPAATRRRSRILSAAVSVAGIAVVLILAIVVVRGPLAGSSGGPVERLGAAPGSTAAAVTPSAPDGQGRLIYDWPPGDPDATQAPGRIDYVYNADGEEIALGLASVGALHGTGADRGYQWTDANGKNVVSISYASEQADGTPDPLAPPSLHIVLATQGAAGLTVHNRAVHSSDDFAGGDCGAMGRVTHKNTATLISDFDADGVAEIYTGWAATCGDPKEPWRVGIDVFEGGDTYTLSGRGFLSPAEADAYRATHPEWNGPAFASDGVPPEAWPGRAFHRAALLFTDAFGGCQRGAVAPCGNADAGAP